MKSSALPFLARAGALLLILPVAAPQVRALEWVTREFNGEAQPLQQTLDIAFSFRNGGSAPVVIRDIQTNCDCLVAQTDKRTYAAGEAGLLTARFSVSERAGLHERAITVVTDEPLQPTQRLTVRIEVPELAVFEPRELSWERGAEPVTQSSELEVVPGFTIPFKDFYSTEEHFRIALVTVEEGRRYRVTVTPRDTKLRNSAAIRVRGHAANGKEIVVSLYANIP